MNRLFDRQVLLKLTTRNLLPATQFIVKKPFQNFNFFKTRGNVNNVRKLSTHENPFTAATREHSHVTHWMIDKAVGAVLVPLIPLTIMFPNKLFDLMFAVVICFHSCKGIEAILLDYVRPVLFGSIIPKIAFLINYIVYFIALLGMIHCIRHDMGIGMAIKKFWGIK